MRPEAVIGGAGPHLPIPMFARLPGRGSGAMSDIAEVENQLQEATVAVDAAGTLIGQGGVVDLAGLENHVEQICTKISALSPSKCANLKPRLVLLIDGLNQLTRQLSVQHENAAGQLKGRTSHRKASSAYGADPTKSGRSRNG